MTESPSAALGEDASAPEKRRKTKGAGAPAAVRTYSDALLPGDLSGSSISDALYAMRRHYAPLGFLDTCTPTMFLAALQRAGTLRDARLLTMPCGSRPP